MPTNTVDPAMQRLESLTLNSPELEDAAQVYAVLLPLLRAADLHAASISLSTDQAHAKLGQGLPLLHGLDLDLDYGSARALMIQLSRALEHARVPGTRPIRLALERGQLETRVILARVAAGESGYVSALAEGVQLDPGLVWTIAHNTLKPAMRAWRSQLNPFLEGVEWRRGYCPICGSGATLGELQGNDQSKHLRCAQCGADWPFPQLQCMYCGNEDHSTLSYFYSEGEREKQRIEVCDQCGGYLKVIASFSPIPVQVLTIEDLATLYLDYIAQERGYARVQVR